MKHFATTLVFGTFLITSTAAHAQTVPLWKEPLKTQPAQFGPTPFGSMLVQLKTGLFAVNSETGIHVWSRPEVTDYELIAGTPFAVFTTAKGKAVADLESGKDVWAFASLGLNSTKGQIVLPGPGLVLVYGPTAESAHTLVAVEMATGKVTWKQTTLFSDPAFARKASDVVYVDFTLDTDHTIVLDPYLDGLIRLDLRSGAVVWRISEANLPSKNRSPYLYPAGDLLIAAYDNRLYAINNNAGNVVWARPKNFWSRVVQAEATPDGVLVRGSYTFMEDETKIFLPFLALLDPATGETKWNNEKGKFSGYSPFVLEGGTATIVSTDGVATYRVSTGEVMSTIAMPAFSGKEIPCCLERTSDGNLRVWSSQNLRLFDAKGALLYSKYFKAPGGSLVSKIGLLAASIAATGASQAAAAPGGMYNVYVPGASSPFYAKYKQTVDADKYIYVLTEEDGSAPDRFALVRIDKATGKDTGRVKFTDRSPTFQLDPVAGIVLFMDKDVLTAFKFPSRAQ